MAANQRVLAVAARSGRLGCAYLEDGELSVWDTSVTGAKTVEDAAKVLRRWIAEYRPNVLISENPDAAGNKHGIQIPILQTFMSVGDDQRFLNLVVRRKRRFENAYVEARHFAEMFPDTAPQPPEKPPIWGAESYSLVVFEALVLANEAGILRAA